MTCSIILFVQSLKTPKLQDQKRNELEGKITLVECKVVLRTFSSRKSPGEDGFTWEFDNCSFDVLGQDLVNCFNEAYVKGEMSILQQRGVVRISPPKRRLKPPKACKLVSDYVAKC